MRLANWLTHFARKDDGATAVVFALVLVAVLGVAGLGVDVGRSVSMRSKMNAALDAAVLAGVRATSEDQAAAATKIFNSNFTEKSVKNLSLTFTPTSDTEFSGTATAQLDTTFAAVLGVKELNFKSVSKAAATGGGTVCVLVLDKMATQAFLVNSGAQVEAPDCELHVQSTANPAAIFNAGSKIDTQRICIYSKHIIDNGGTHPNLELECIPSNDPFAGKLTEPSSSPCKYSNLNFNGGNVTLNPGVYCGWTNFNGGPNVTLKPGVYVIKSGGWNVNGGTWSGSGVTFFFADQSKIQFNSGVSANITAPTSGTYKDLVMFEKSGLSRSQMVFDNSHNMDMRGIIYLPSRDVTFNHGSNMYNKKMTLVVNTLILDGTHWGLEPATDDILSGGVKAVHLTE